MATSLAWRYYNMSVAGVNDDLKIAKLYRRSSFYWAVMLGRHMLYWPSILMANVTAVERSRLKENILVGIYLISVVATRLRSECRR